MKILLPFLISLALFFIACLALGVSYFLTGKNRLKKSCSQVLWEDKDNCPLCGTTEACQKEES